MQQPENNGVKVYTLLVELNTRTGQPTGRIAANIPSNPNYIAPVTDLVSCPLPGTPVFNFYNVVVSIGAGITATVQLWYSTDNISQTGSNAAWNIVDRTYDSVIFLVTGLPTGVTDYTVKITYQDGTVKSTNVTGINSTVIPGPFTAISEIDVISNTGDYNDDYSNDFFN